MNTVFSSFLRFLDLISPPQKAHAHCDVPCGVYETDSMKWAVETCEKLVAKMLQLDVPAPGDKHSQLEYFNTLTRAILVKEEYAQICKTQILILWTDYFKPEHLAKFPDLHDKIWKAAKQCSKNKQETNMDAAKELQEAVHEIGHIFVETKK